MLILHCCMYFTQTNFWAKCINVFAGVYIFLFDGEYVQITCLGKKIIENGGKMHVFSPIGKKCAYFLPPLT